ncbi:MAG: phosphoglucosamine mutase [Flavobacteriales bacterium AspAUS03]
MALIKSVSGIRGTIGGQIGESLSPLDVVKFSAAYGMWLKNQCKRECPIVVLGRDARLSGETVRQLTVATLQNLGIDVIDLGLSTTPTVEMAVIMEKADGGIVLTASHNPKHWNALKLLNHHAEFLSEEAGNAVLLLAEKEDFSFVGVDRLGCYNLKEDYIQRHIKAILDLSLVDTQAIKASGFKAVVDGVNSTGGIAVPMLLHALGVETVKLFCEPDGHFLHDPEPLCEHLSAICEKVLEVQADLGIAVDPDVDRLVFICENGDLFGEEYTLVAVADYVLEKKSGPTVSNLSSSRALQDISIKRGVVYHSAAVGEVHVVEKMKQTSAVIGGEGNGGIIYPELHYGRDALVGIALFLTQLAYFGGQISQLRMKYPVYFMSKQKIKLPPKTNVDSLLQALAKHYEKESPSLIDGVKIDFAEEWVHLRKSNTEPIVRIYAESTSQAKADILANRFLNDIYQKISVL